MPSPRGIQPSGRVSREDPAGSGAGLLTQESGGDGRSAPKVEAARRDAVDNTRWWTGGLDPPSTAGTQRGSTADRPHGGVSRARLRRAGEGRRAPVRTARGPRAACRMGTWTGGDSNPGPLPCEGSALPAELPAPGRPSVPAAGAAGAAAQLSSTASSTKYVSQASSRSLVVSSGSRPRYRQRWTTWLRRSRGCEPWKARPWAT